SVSWFGRRLGRLRPGVVALLLEIAMLRRALGVDLPLLGIGALFLFLLRGRLARARGRRGRGGRIDLRGRRCISLRLGRRRSRASGRLCPIGTLVASGGQSKHGGQSEDLQTHVVLSLI